MRTNNIKESFVLKGTFETEQSIICNAWLDSDLHGKMPGGEA